jgi:hypothetical protein
VIDESNLARDIISRAENKPATGSILILMIPVNIKTGYGCSPQDKTWKFSPGSAEYLQLPHVNSLFSGAQENTFFWVMEYSGERRSCQPVQR